MDKEVRRIVFVDLHLNGQYVNSLKKVMYKKRYSGKHRYFLDWLIKNKIPVYNFVSNNESEMPFTFLRKYLCKKQKCVLEADLVFKINGIKNVKNITEISDIKDNDIVLAYIFDIERAGNTKKMDEMKAKKVIHLIHFYGFKSTSDLIKKIKPLAFAYEVNPTYYSKMYQKNFSWFQGPIIIHPFVVQKRFQRKLPFSLRENKAMSIGTLTDVKGEEYEKINKTSCYQPMRKQLLDYSDKIEKWLDSYVSPYQEKQLYHVEKNELIFKRFYKRLYNSFNSGIQKNYFSFDMVEKFNQYKMFVCPEDINGAYGIGMFEGMACGCAYIGWENKGYMDLGMIPGIHYIGYDGTIGNLIEKIEYYQQEENQEEINAIAENGYNLIKTKYATDRVSEEFYRYLCHI